MRAPFSRQLAWIGAALALAAIAGIGLIPASRAADSGDPNNPGTLDIQNLESYSAIYALSDLHGMYAPATVLLRAGGLIDADARWSGGRAFLVVIGDSIDKGPRSLALLDLWIRLQGEAAAQGGRVLHLLGNHEAEFLADPDNHKARVFRDELDAAGVRPEDIASMRTERGAFLLGQPLAARVGRWLFAHAGFFPATNWDDFTREATRALRAGRYDDDLLAGDDSILEARDWRRTEAGLDREMDRLRRAGFAGVVFGHQPKAFDARGRIASVREGRIVKIDCGMAPDQGAHAGQLLKIPNPLELAQSAGAPHFQTIAPDGAARELRPETVPLREPTRADPPEAPGGPE